MDAYATNRMLSELLGAVGLLAYVATQSPGVAQFDSPLLVGGTFGLFTTGVMGRALCGALAEKPNVMSPNTIYIGWGVTMLAGLLTGVVFVPAGEVSRDIAILLVFLLSLGFSSAISSIEPRETANSE